MSNSSLKKPLLEIRDLKSYFHFEKPEISPADGFIAEALWKRHHYAPKKVYMEDTAKVWDYGRRERKIDGVDYTEIAGKTEVRAVDGATLTVHENESVAILGETGCGKSSLILSIPKLLFPDYCKHSGEIVYTNPKTNLPLNLLELTESDLNKIRGKHIGMIMQVPKEALDPIIELGLQSGEVLEKKSWREEKIRERVIEFLGKVALPDPEINIRKYVHQLSGGEAQRVCIAMALLADPYLLLGDEPLRSLDAIIQQRIISLLQTLKKDLKTSYLIATHNIGAAGQLAEIIAIMYGGEIVEITSSEKFVDEPLHPYSKGLLHATPWHALRRNVDIEEIRGDLPSATNWPKGCKFHPRCSKCMNICKKERPPRIEVNGSFVNCFLYS